MEIHEFKGKLTEDEAGKLQKIFQRKMALLEIMPTIKSPMDRESLDYLYEKLVNDLQQTNQKMHDWWVETSSIHGWEYAEGDSWSVNFNDKEVTITQSDTKD